MWQYAVVTVAAPAAVLAWAWATGRLVRLP